jgi:glycosyltransferase 2 family protein
VIPAAGDAYDNGLHPLISLSVRLGVAAGVLGVLFYFVPTDAVIAALAGIDPAWFGAGLLLQFVLRGVATLRMKVIADSQNMNLGHATLWRILLATQFYSMLVPGPIAGGGATWLKYVQHGAERGAATAAILLNRGLSFLVMLTVGAAAWFIDAEHARTWIAAAPIALGVLLLGLANGRWAAAGARSEPASTPWLLRTARELIGRLRLFGDIAPLGKLIVLTSSVLHEIVGAAIMWCFAMAAGLEVPLLTVLWMRAALQLVLLLPLSIAGLGLREAGLVGLCALIDVPAATAMAWSLTIFVGTVLVAASGGLIEAGTVSSNVLRMGTRLRRGSARSHTRSGVE